MDGRFLNILRLCKVLCCSEEGFKVDGGFVVCVIDLKEEDDWGFVKLEDIFYVLIIVVCIWIDFLIFFFVFDYFLFFY